MSSHPGTGAPAPPSLAEAIAGAVALITAVHAAIRGAKAKPAVRKAYGASTTATKEAKAVLEDGAMILTRAQANPTEALSLGILPSDVTALSQALAAVRAAEIAATGSKGGAATAKERHAAEARVHEAVARIAGAGTLAFATNAPVRAELAALIVKKKA